ncbi:pseudaminic acid biosynthesis-associated methylase [Nocardioides nitrophenolicus]|uniref:pseudaminic acid biosynthesis-associated methylase n=1 Tax=Nocardioides nitrophenolicus TaxID=60489 RepID=UPI00195C854E|nr:pseudaminic acid biosynthesis-associated methylase [Nocardioides nitrophenolicus]MBM7518716.1 spore coat polysaccharide biosynthesis protein SpsF [Nocardioides nitrophenolicus]
MTEFKTQQESFWAGDFGSEYISRNVDASYLAANLAFFAPILERTAGVSSILELGANVGMNLRALRQLLPAASLAAVEINATAAAELRSWGEATVHEGSILSHVPDEPVDLSFTKGVLIHIAPDQLPAAYDRLVAASRRYVLVAEYYNPSPVTVSYRGHDDRLFKRDFAGEILDRHPELSLLDYGFVYRRDRSFPQDDITWFLMERPCG